MKIELLEEEGMEHEWECNLNSWDDEEVTTPPDEYSPRLTSGYRIPRITSGFPQTLANPFLWLSSNATVAINLKLVL